MIDIALLSVQVFSIGLVLYFILQYFISGSPFWNSIRLRTFKYYKLLKEEDLFVSIYHINTDKDDEHNGLFIPSLNTILLLNGKHVSTILHELGHYQDYLTNPELFVGISNDDKSLENIIIIQQLEINAWRFAIQFSNKYNLPFPKNDIVDSLLAYNIDIHIIGDICSELN